MDIYVSTILVVLLMVCTSVRVIEFLYSNRDFEPDKLKYQGQSLMSRIMFLTLIPLFAFKNLTLIERIVLIGLCVVSACYSFFVATKLSNEKEETWFDR